MAKNRHTKEELNEVALAARDGDRDAAEELVEMMRPYVRSVVGKIRGDYRRADRDEMEQAAYVGIFEALEKFDPSRGTKFSTYAWYYIQDKVFEWLGANSGTITLPKTAWKYAKHVETEMYHVDNTKHVSEFTDEELAEQGPYGHLPYAGDLFRARATPFQLDADRDSTSAPSAEAELLGDDESTGHRRPGVSSDLERETLLFVDTLQELHEDERWWAATQFCSEHGLAPEVADRLLEAADL